MVADIADTPTKKYDLINQVNARGTFLTTKLCLPHMKKNGFGRVVTMSPPIATRGIAGRTAYCISKFGMTLTALGAAEEYFGEGITSHSLWPATIIESLASKNFQLGDVLCGERRRFYLIAVGLVCETDEKFTGRMLIDDEYLRERHGFRDEDFVQYRCDPDVEPGRFLAQHRFFFYCSSWRRQRVGQRSSERCDRRRTEKPFVVVVVVVI